MEITPEIREKVFVQYWGQKVLLMAPGLIEYVGTNWNLKHDRFKFLLRPLSAITQEQMKKCLQLLGYTGFKDVKYDGGFIVWQQKLQYSYTTKSLLLDHRMPAIVYQFLVDEGFDTKKYLLSGKTLHEAGLAKHINEI